MDVLEAVNKRKSIRAFKSDPVPAETLKKTVEGALHAPSASNSQPWELAIVSGAKLEEIKKAVIENTGRPTVDMPGAIQYPEPYASRRAAVMEEGDTVNLLTYLPEDGLGITDEQYNITALFYEPIQCSHRPGLR